MFLSGSAQKLNASSCAVGVCHSRISTWFGISIVSTWLILTVVAFWFFQWKFVRPIDQEMPRTTARWFEEETFQGMFDLSIQAGSKGLVVHFWDPNCPCSRFSKAHVQVLLQRALAEGVSSVVVVKASTSFWAVDALKEAKTLFPQSDWVVSADQFSGLKGKLTGSPAAAVFDGDGRVRYAGPYSSDAFCRTDDGNGFVELAIADLNSPPYETGKSEAILSACYCDW